FVLQFCRRRDQRPPSLSRGRINYQACASLASFCISGPEVRSRRIGRSRFSANLVSVHTIMHLSYVHRDAPSNPTQFAIGFDSLIGDAGRVGTANASASMVAVSAVGSWLSMVGPRVRVVGLRPPAVRVILLPYIISRFRVPVARIWMGSSFS